MLAALSSRLALTSVYSILRSVMLTFRMVPCLLLLPSQRKQICNPCAITRAVPDSVPRSPARQLELLVALTATGPWPSLARRPTLVYAVGQEPSTRVPRVVQMLVRAPSCSYGFFNPRLNSFPLQGRCIPSVCLATLMDRSSPRHCGDNGYRFCWNRPSVRATLVVEDASRKKSTM